ncbi:2-hydroxychromene-2-carboxylate isomerase [Pelomicrobium sp. G1]|uniref:2-hydroxychromene-2-carboxylate isomerase n=1 Tax=unclassified Pelomicrobium TaxID=2815318 RepID=UPI003F75C97A
MAVATPRVLDWYFDYVSPFSYLQLEAFHRLPAGVTVRPRPILFAGLLDAWGHKGPAEIPEKRKFTYRFAVWTADKYGIPLKFPPAHPFNPLKPLRLTVALGDQPAVVRHIFRFIWREGRLVEDPKEWARLAAELGAPDADAKIAQPWVKERLKANGEEAVGRGVFGVPTFWVEAELFWGFDATDFLLTFLENPGLLREGELARVSSLPAATQRKGHP